MKTKMHKLHRKVRSAGKTCKNMKKSGNKYSHPHIVVMFLQMLNTVKLFHWKTTSFAQHKATDDLYSNLNSSIDSFVEILLGKTGTRVNLTGTKSIPLLDYNDVTNFKQEIESSSTTVRTRAKVARPVLRSMLTRMSISAP